MKSDYKVVAVLLFVLVLLGVAFVFLDKHVDVASSDGKADSTKVESEQEEKPQYYSDFEIKKHNLQNFDPNTADSTLLLSLGLPDWMVRGIYKYRYKGGTYSTPEDFARTPGLTVKQYKELLPYIQISDDYRSAAELVGPREYQHEQPAQPRDTTKQQKKLSAGERINVNTADTTQLKTIPGIGSYYAKKIVETRERLGGFTSHDQLLTIKNFPQDALDYMIIPDGGIKKININTATFNQINAHPYISYEQTKEIMNYRRLKGKLQGIDNLRFMKSFTEEDIAKIEPYVEF